MNYYESSANNTADASGKERVVTRFREVDISTDRFISVHSGTKAPSQKWRAEGQSQPPENVSRDYGIKCGKGLLVLDIDRPEKVSIDLPPTFTVTSPHGDVDRGHHYYRIEQDVASSKAEWGEIQSEGAIVIGPDTLLDHEGYCQEDCQLSGTGAYEIIDDRPIETISVDTLEPILADDDESDDAVSGEAVERNVGDRDTRIKRGLNSNSNFQELWDWAREGGSPAEVGFPDDRSAAETALAAHLGFWLNGDIDAVRDVLNQINPPKWSESGESYRQSVLETGDNGVYYDSENEGSGVSSEAISEVAIALVSQEGRASTTEIIEEELVNIHEEQARRVLEIFEGRGLVRYERDGRTGEWVTDNSEELLRHTSSDEIDEQFNSRQDWLNWCRRNL